MIKVEAANANPPTELRTATCPQATVIESLDILGNA